MSFLVSVVIPAFNEAKLLPATLAAVDAARRAFSERGWSSEVVVCDNNSTDATAEIARAAGAVVVFEPFNQIGRARNSGAQAAKGDWLVFIDADSQPTAALFDAAADRMASGRAIACGSTLRLDGGGFSLHALTAAWNLASRFNRCPAGSFIAVDTAAFRAIGGFDTRLYIGEELDLAVRLRRLGRKQRRRIEILHSAPLLTSARKSRLYSGSELARMLARAVFRPVKTMRDRSACAPWYDGRR